MRQELFNALTETLLMVSVSGIFTLVIGLSLGILITLTGPKQIFANRILHKILETMIRGAQSLPYVIFMIILMPITGYLMSKKESWLVAILPLSLATIPYFAHQCQEAFNKIPASLIELTTFLGARPIPMIRKVLLPEAWPGIIQAFTNTLVQLVGYSAIAGLLGAGGLGSLAIQKGYPNFQARYVFATAIILILFIQGLKSLGNYFAKKLSELSTNEGIIS